MNTIARRRLAHQFLSTPTLRTATEVVRTLGAVQAQDYGSAKWGVAQRTPRLTDADVERACMSGAILRTHVLRPTWHFVLPQDARWMLELTGPRVLATQTYYNRVLGLDRTAFRKSNQVLERTLAGGSHRTRAELAAVLRRAGIHAPTGQHIGHLLMRAELDRVIISGPRRGKQFTYALFDEQVPLAPPRDRDEALQDLTLRYFATRGPATVQDFAWWSGLTIAEATRGVEAAAPRLERTTVADRVYWHVPSPRSAPRARAVAHLLPNYDEYFIGLRDRSAFGERLLHIPPSRRLNALRGHIAFVDGQVVGGWRRTLGKTLEIELQPLVKLSAREHELVRRAALRFGRFLGLTPRVRVRV